MRVLSAAALAVGLVATGAQAAPRAWVRDVAITTGWRWGLGPSAAFATTLREAVDDQLAVCAAGQDLRIDLKIDQLDIRQPTEQRRNAANRLRAQVEVRQWPDKSLVDLRQITVQTPDDGLLAHVRDPEIILAEATGEAICAELFPPPASPAP